MNLIDLKELIKILKISRSAIYLNIKRGVWPKAIKISSRANRWFLHEVEEMVHLMAAGANEEQIRKKVQKIHEVRKIGPQSS